MRLFSSFDKHSLQKIYSQYLVQINLIIDLLILMFYMFSYYNSVFLQICFLTKFMMIIFMLQTVDDSLIAILANLFAFSFSMMFLQLNIHCM